MTIIAAGWFDGEGWTDAFTIVIATVAAVGAYFLVRFMLTRASRAASESAWRWDDILTDRRVLHRLSLLGPALLVYAGARIATDASGTGTDWLRRISAAVVIMLVAATLSAMLGAVNTIYERTPQSRDRPIEAYIQVIQIIVYLFGGIFTIAVLADQPPWFFVGGLGAMTAVLLLIFKDTILSFVASVRLVQGDMVDVGDWIEVPEYGADGDVIDVALHTITVQNFDKTISTIPTHELVNRSFRNWRGMAEAGRRRIKRTIDIDIATIRFLTDEEIRFFEQFEPLEDYMAGKLEEIEADRARSRQEGYAGDPRRLTNIGTLRAYIISYLRRIQSVDTDESTFLVRQLQPTPHGLPLEIYVFAVVTDWAEYEVIQADIFDHILAMVPRFGLRVFQEPTGDDVRTGAPGTGEGLGLAQTPDPVGGTTDTGALPDLLALGVDRNGSAGPFAV